MSNWIESKFHIDYRNFETLPNQVADNLHEINARIKGAEKIMRIKDQIDDLKYALEAETHLIASEVLENNVFPRFDGYSEFINSNCENTVSQNPTTFCELATAISNKDFDDKKEICDKFQYRLNDFIWLFFDGCGTFNTTKKLAIDYANYKYVYGSYNEAYPPEISYFFNATNFNDGKTYKVVFSFYDLKKALDFQHLRSKNPEMSPNVFLSAPFESIRLSGFGKIICTIAEIKEAERDGIHQLGDRIYLTSFDPLEIAAFIRGQTVNEKDSGDGKKH